MGDLCEDLCAAESGLGNSVGSAFPTESNLNQSLGLLVLGVLQVFIFQRRQKAKVLT